MCCVGKSLQQFTAYTATGMIDVYSPFTATEPIFTSNANRFGYQMDQSPLAIHSQLDETYRLAALYWFLRRMYAPVGRVYGPPPPPPPARAPNRRKLIDLMFPITFKTICHSSRFFKLHPQPQNHQHQQNRHRRHLDLQLRRLKHPQLRHLKELQLRRLKERLRKQSQKARHRPARNRIQLFYFFIFINGKTKWSCTVKYHSHVSSIIVKRLKCIRIFVFILTYQLLSTPGFISVVVRVLKALRSSLREFTIIKHMLCYLFSWCLFKDITSKF